MIKVLYVRHGQTDYNKKMLIQGSIDIPLNEVGINEASSLHLKLLNTEIDYIFSSPLKRALQTAEIIKGKRNIPLLIDSRLKEENYGDYEGKTRIDNPDYEKQRRSIFKRYPHGESYLDVYARISSFFEDIKKDYQNKTILIVAHGGMSRVVNCYFKDMENDDFPSYAINNCEVVTYQLDC